MVYCELVNRANWNRRFIITSSQSSCGLAWILQMTLWMLDEINAKNLYPMDTIHWCLVFDDSVDFFLWNGIILDVWKSFNYVICCGVSVKTSKKGLAMNWCRRFFFSCA